MRNKSPAIVIILLFIISGIIPNITGYNIDTKGVDTTDIIISSGFQNGSLSGYVNDTLGNPIEGVRIRVSFHNTYVENFSDTSGYYYVSNIPICYCLKNATTIKLGYKSEWVLLSINESTKYDFELTKTSKILYVGGDGSGNYTKINDALNDAVEGDTVYVFNGTYIEEVIIRKSNISLIGESRENTIIDGNNRFWVIGTKGATPLDNIKISGFTLRNCRNSGNGRVLHLRVKNCEVSDNIIIAKKGDETEGILLRNGDNNIIRNNIISEGDFGIDFVNIDNNTISENIFHNNSYAIQGFGESNNIFDNEFINNNKGIDLGGFYNNIMNNDFSYLGEYGINIDLGFCVISNNTLYSGKRNGINLVGYNHTIINNKISNFRRGIQCYYNNNTIISKNDISNNEVGIYLYSWKNNKMYHNNFRNNNISAIDEYETFWDNGYEGNYWSDYEEKYPDASRKLRGVWDTPYEIPEGDSKDRFPLVKPYGKPKSKLFVNNVLVEFLESHPNLFPILRQLLEL